MLILSRKVGEKIFIGDNITITVCDFPNSNRVRLGIEAPRNVEVLRSELAGNRDAILTKWGRIPKEGT